MKTHRGKDLSVGGEIMKLPPGSVDGRHLGINVQTMVLPSVAPLASFRSGIGDAEEQGDSSSAVWVLVTQSSMT